MAAASTTDRTTAKEDASTRDVQAELENLRRDIAALTQALTALGNDKLQEAGSRASKLGADVAEASTQAFRSARSSAVSAEHDLEAQIRSHPLQAIGIAAGIGFLAALLTRR